MARYNPVKYAYIATLNDRPLFFVSSYESITEWLKNIPALEFEEDNSGGFKYVKNENGIYSFYMVPEKKYSNA